MSQSKGAHFDMRKIQEWCKNYSEMLYFKQIATHYADTKDPTEVFIKNIIEKNKLCKLSCKSIELCSIPILYRGGIVMINA